MQIFNNREVAYIFWIIIVLCIALSIGSIRRSIFNVLRAAFAKKIVYIYLSAVIYTGICVWVLYIIGFWNISLIKTTVLWIVLVSSPAIYKNARDTKNENLFSEQIKDNLNLTIVLEFIIGFYSFPLLLELFIIPIICMIGILSVIPDPENKFYKVKKGLNRIIKFLGFMFFSYALANSFYKPEEFYQISTLKDFILSPILSLLFIPFIYILIASINYELFFLRMEYSIKSPIILNYAKRQSILHFHFNFKALDRWQEQLFMLNLQSKEDVLKSIKEIKELYKTETNPPIIDNIVGWSPYTVKDFLIENGIKTGHYKKSYDNEWFACSEQILIGDVNDIISNNIAYYVEGNQMVANSIKLVLNIHMASRAKNIHEQLLLHSKLLYTKIFNSSMPIGLERGILNGTNTQIKDTVATVIIIRDNWITNKGYTITFEIRHH